MNYWHITFNGATYDSGTNKTTFSYTVCSDANRPESEKYAMSHWVLSLCIGTPDSAYDDFTGTGDCGLPAGFSCVLTPTWGDPETGVIGIKFDGNLGDGNVGECKDFSFKLYRNWTGATGTVIWAIKRGGPGGGDTGQGTTTGPDCAGGPTAVTLSSFDARSSTGGLASGLWLGLAGLALAASGLFWMKRRVG